MTEAIRYRQTFIRKDLLVCFQVYSKIDYSIPSHILDFTCLKRRSSDRLLGRASLIHVCICVYERQKAVLPSLLLSHSNRIQNSKPPFPDIRSSYIFESVVRFFSVRSSRCRSRREEKRCRGFII